MTGALALPSRRAVAGVVLSAAVLTALGAQAAPRVGERVSITACPYPGATSTCLLINGPDGTVYNITGASPRPRLFGRMIWLRGTVTDKPSLCAQGVVLDRIRWTRVRQKCSSQ